MLNCWWRNEKTNMFNWNSFRYLPNKIQLLVAVVKYKSKLVEPRLGLCSNFLANLNVGDKVPIWVKKGKLWNFFYLLTWLWLFISFYLEKFELLILPKFKKSDSLSIIVYSPYASFNCLKLLRPLVKIVW